MSFSKNSVIRAAFTAAFLGSFAVAAMAQSTQPTSFKYTFGAEKAGFTQVKATDAYADAAGYGFEPGSVATAGSGDVTSKQPFFFSAKVPEGNYLVTVTLGSADQAATTTVKAELRRLMLEQVHTAAGETVSRTFAVNIRTPQFPGGQVRLKPREIKGQSEWRAWDERMTLEFSGDNPAIQSIDIEPAGNLPVVYICGDSTTCDQPVEPFNSWGQMITRWLKPDVVVANEGESGETLPAFFGEKRWDKVMNTLKAGDYVICVFGHNDMKNPTGEPPAKYADFYARIVADAHSKGATPIIMTPVSRQSFGPDGKITNSFGGYPDAVRALAKDKGIAFIDLQKQGAAFYEAIGKEKAPLAFANPTEKTHHSDYGSYNIAKCVMQGIIDLKLPLADHVTADWKTYDPSHPDMPADFKVPLDPRQSRMQTPAGS